jgi:hypothetical protein
MVAFEGFGLRPVMISTVLARPLNDFLKESRLSFIVSRITLFYAALSGVRMPSVVRLIATTFQIGRGRQLGGPYQHFLKLDHQIAYAVAAGSAYVRARLF